MAAVRIEAEAFSDERYEDLATLAGLADADHARGKMTRLWRQCTIEQSHRLPVALVVRVLGPNAVAALEGARLGERVSDTEVRIRGTKGRIEWLKKLRDNGRFGARGGRPKKNPSGFSPSNPDGSHNETPLTPALTLTPALAPVNSEKNSARPSGSGSRSRKPKPADPTHDEREAALRVLGKLSERNGVRYSGSGDHVGLIVRHLRSGVSEMDLRYVVGYCAAELGWQTKPDLVAYLRPETLFGPKTLSKYLDPARAWVGKLPDTSRVPGDGAS